MAAETAGRSIRIRLGRADAAAPGTACASRPAPEEKPEPRPGAAPEAAEDHDSLLARATNEPGIKKLLYEFGARVVEIRPLDAPGDSPSSASSAGPTKESP